jgi:hypothetical protein
LFFSSTSRCTCFTILRAIFIEPKKEQKNLKLAVFHKRITTGEFLMTFHTLSRIINASQKFIATIFMSFFLCALLSLISHFKKPVRRDLGQTAIFPETPINFPSFGFGGDGVEAGKDFLNDERNS